MTTSTPTTGPSRPRRHWTQDRSLQRARRFLLASPQPSRPLCPVWSVRTAQNASPSTIDSATAKLSRRYILPLYLAIQRDGRPTKSYSGTTSRIISLGSCGVSRCTRSLPKGSGEGRSLEIRCYEYTLLLEGRYYLSLFASWVDSVNKELYTANKTCAYEFFR